MISATPTASVPFTCFTSFLSSRPVHPTCPVHIPTWMSQRHLRINSAKLPSPSKLLVQHSPLRKRLYLVVQARNLGVTLYCSYSLLCLHHPFSLLHLSNPYNLTLAFKPSPSVIWSAAMSSWPVSLHPFCPSLVHYFEILSLTTSLS